MTNLSSRRYLNISISKAQAKADIRRRLKECLEQPGNKTCADCPEPNPTWASLLPVSSSSSSSSEGKGQNNNHHKKKKKIGVFCCYKCCSYHFQLGRDVCLVKNVKIADDWTEDEVKAMERSGNEVVNAVYEASLTSSEKKRLEGLKGKEEQNARAKFVEDKYKQLKFFSADQRHLSKLDSDEEHHHEGNNSLRAPPHSNGRSGTSSSFPSLPSCNAGQQQSSCSYGSSAFMDRLMEKSTAGIEPKSSTGLEAWGHIISCNEEEDSVGSSSQQDLGYGSDHNNINSSEALDLGYEDTSTIQEDVARELSRRAMGRTLSSRRGSVGRSSIGGSRQDSCLNLGRSNSRGSLVGDDSERPQSFRSRGQGRRGSLGGDAVSDNQGYEPQQSVRNRGRRGSLGGGDAAVPDNLGYERQESIRGRGRRGSLGGPVLDQKSCEKQESFKSSGRRGSLGSEVLDNKGYERQPSFQSSRRRGSLGGVAVVDSCGPEESANPGATGSNCRSESRCRRRGSVGAVSVDNKEHVGNRRRRGSVGTLASTESTDDEDMPATAFQATTRRRRSSVGAGSVRRSNSSVSHGSCAEEEKPRRRSDRRGSIGRRGSLGGGSNSQKSDHDVGVDPAKKGRTSKKEAPSSGRSRRRGSVSGASKSAESRPSRRNSLVGVPASRKSNSPEANGRSRDRRRGSIGRESYSTAATTLSAC